MTPSRRSVAVTLVVAVAAAILTAPTATTAPPAPPAREGGTPGAVVPGASALPEVPAAPSVPGAYAADIGNGDTLVVLTPMETRWLRSALKNPSKISCAPFGIGLPNVVKLLNRFCSGQKAFTWVAYQRVRWFLANAAAWGACGAFVIDSASWRPTRIRAARSWNAPSQRWVDHVWTQLGQTTYFQTSTGWVRVRCGEYADWRQSNIIPRPGGNGMTAASA